MIRSSWQVTGSVWHALFMREALLRATGNRFAWLWMLLEPVLWVLIWVGVHSLLSQLDLIRGADRIPWLLVGLTGFFLFREGLQRSVGAVDANSALFAYRQVKPVDPVLARNALEGMLKTMVLVLLLLGASLLGYEIMPDNPVQAAFAWITMWLLGLGAGLVVSVGATLIPEIGIIVRLSTMPMFLLSGAIIPVFILPHQLQQYLLYYPVLHAVELLRLAFFDGYKTLDGVSMMYVWYWLLSLIALGLALHIRFAMRLRAK